MLRHSQFLLKYSFEFDKNHLTDKKLVLGQYSLEHIPAQSASSERGHQYIGIKQDPHRYQLGRINYPGVLRASENNITGISHDISAKTSSSVSHP